MTQLDYFNWWFQFNWIVILLCFIIIIIKLFFLLHDLYLHLAIQLEYLISATLWLLQLVISIQLNCYFSINISSSDWNMKTGLVLRYWVMLQLLIHIQPAYKHEKWICCKQKKKNVAEYGRIRRFVSSSNSMKWIANGRQWKRHVIAIDDRWFDDLQRFNGGVLISHELASMSF